MTAGTLFATAALCTLLTGAGLAQVTGQTHPGSEGRPAGAYCPGRTQRGTDTRRDTEPGAPRSQRKPRGACDAPRRRRPPDGEDKAALTRRQNNISRSIYKDKHNAASAKRRAEAGWARRSSGGLGRLGQSARITNTGRRRCVGRGVGDKPVTMRPVTIRLRERRIVFMWTVLLSLMLACLPQLTPAHGARRSPVRIERLTPDEQKQLKECQCRSGRCAGESRRRRKAQEANKSDATTKAASDAQMKLAQAERELKGTRRRHQPEPPCQHGVRLLRAVAGPRLRPGGVQGRFDRDSPRA